MKPPRVKRTPTPPKVVLWMLGAAGLGWLVGGWPGAIAGAVAALVARGIPQLLPFLAPATLVAMVVAVLAEGDLGAPRDIASFGRDRPVAHGLGLAAAVVSLSVSLIPRAKIDNGERGSLTQVARGDPPEEGTAPDLLPAPGGASHPELVPAAVLLVVAIVGWWVGLWPDTMLVVFAWLATVVTVAGLRLATWLEALAGRTRPQEGERQLLTGSAWLVAGTVVVSVGSFLYWLLAARIVDKDAVGNASAMFTACFLLSLLASPGLVITVSRFGSEPRRTPTAVYAWSLLVSLAGAVIVAALFTVSAPRRVDDALAGLPPAATLAILAAMVGGQAVSALTDVRLIGRREWEWLFARHAAITVIRLAGLAFVGSDPNGRRLFLLAIGAFALTGLPFVPASLRTSDGWPRLGDIRGHTASVVNYSLTNAVGQLAIQGTALLAPLTVLGWVSSDEFAELYIGWGIMSVVFAGIQLVTQILLVEGSRAGAGRPHQIRTALQVTVGGAVVASVASIPFQALVPRLYGDDFAATAELILPLMTGTVPWAVTGVALTAARIRADHRQSVMISAVFAVAVIGLVMIGTMLGGTMGASVGWLAGSTVAAGYAWRDLRAHEPRAGADAAAGPVAAEALAGGPDG